MGIYRVWALGCSGLEDDADKTDSKGFSSLAFRGPK